MGRGTKRRKVHRDTNKDVTNKEINASTVWYGLREKEGMEGCEGPDREGREEAQKSGRGCVEGRRGKRKRDKFRTAHKKQRAFYL